MGENQDGLLKNILCLSRGTKTEGYFNKFDMDNFSDDMKKEYHDITGEAIAARENEYQ